MHSQTVDKDITMRRTKSWTLFLKSLAFFLLLIDVKGAKANSFISEKNGDLEDSSFALKEFNEYTDEMPTSSKDERNLSKKPINCDRIDSDFFRYLLRRYNKDRHATGRMVRLCGNLEYAATHCDQSHENLFNLIHNPQTNQMNEDDHNFSQSIIRLCPLILFKVQNQKCSSSKVLLPAQRTKPNPKYVWGLAFLFVTIISCCSLVGVVVMPFTNTNTDSYKDAFNLFEGLAVGSLVASSLFHLLPQAFNLTGSKSDDYLGKAMLIFGGIYLFFWSEILMKLFTELRKKKKKKSVCQTNLELLENEAKVIRDLQSKENTKLVKQDKDESKQEIANVAWMIIFGDGLHNLIDGLSIGAAFSESIMSGVSVSISVICEEIPHELGDFAVLIASGMTMKQAIGYNFLSACTCYIGAVLGIIIGDLTSTSSYILALAGGMFLYVALVNIMSELTHSIDEALIKSKSKMFKVLLYQNVGILSGILFLFLLAKYSEFIRIHAIASSTSQQLYNVIY